MVVESEDTISASAMLNTRNRRIKVEYKVWQCMVCGYEYNEELGDEEHGLAPGTRWEDVPEDWECPECGAAKSDFEMIEA